MSGYNANCLSKNLVAINNISEEEVAVEDLSEDMKGSFDCGSVFCLRKDKEEDSGWRFIM